MLHRTASRKPLILGRKSTPDSNTLCGTRLGHRRAAGEVMKEGHLEATNLLAATQEGGLLACEPATNFKYMSAGISSTC